MNSVVRITWGITGYKYIEIQIYPRFFTGNYKLDFTNIYFSLSFIFTFLLSSLHLFEFVIPFFFFHFFFFSTYSFFLPYSFFSFHPLYWNKLKGFPSTDATAFSSRQSLYPWLSSGVYRSLSFSYWILYSIHKSSWIKGFQRRVDKFRVILRLVIRESRILYI